MSEASSGGAERMLEPAARTYTAMDERHLRPEQRYNSPITQREAEVAAMVAEGLTNEEIAAKLVLVPGTVSNHVANIFRKLGFNRRAQIASWAVATGLYTPDRLDQPNQFG
jgi:DNA-binding NarL/FixJ family response regulator